MANVLVQESSLQGIAAAIREKNGATTTYKPAQMAEAISALEIGGGFYPSLLITAPTGHTITATNGVDTVTLSEISEGKYWGEVTDYGEWTVSDSGGGIGPVIDVVEVAQYTGEVLYASETFADNDWETISKIGNSGLGASIWSIGDTYPITINGTVGVTSYTNASYHVFIAHFNYKGQNGIYLMGFMDQSTRNALALKDANHGTQKQNGTKTHNINHWGSSSSPWNTNYGGWKGCDLRYDILGSTNKQPSGYGSTATASRVGYDPENYDIVNSPVSNTLMAALEIELREHMKPFTVYTDNKGGGSAAAEDVTASVDYIVLPAEYEVFGTPAHYANTNEPAQQEQLEFYELGNSKIVYEDKRTTSAFTKANRWLRSPYYYTAYDFVTANINGNSSVSTTMRSNALTPLLRVA